jgi:hypothetical protein
VPRGIEASPEAEAARIAPLVSGALAELGRSLRVGLRTKELERVRTRVSVEAVCSRIHPSVVAPPTTTFPPTPGAIS